MNDVDHAIQLLRAARRDLDALAGMQADRAQFADEICGFHAQQAVEKALKSWLAFGGTAFPRSHDLQALLDLLQAEGHDVTAFVDVVALNQYAVIYRYESLGADDLDSLDRAHCLELATAVVRAVETIVRISLGESDVR